MVVANIALPIVVAWILAALFWFALRLGDRSRSLVVAALFVAMLALPFLAPTEYPLWRGIAAILCVMPWIKAYDVHFERRLGGRAPALGRYLGFLVNPCMLVQRRLDDEPQPPPEVETRRIVRGLVVLLPASAFLMWLFATAERQAWPFWLEHSAKASVVFAMVYGVLEIITGLWRIAGFRGRTMTLNFFAARTPAEFWRLYNRHTGQFFYEDVSRPLQRRIGVAWATMAAFAASGVGHEYLAFVAIGQVQMLQTSFFLLHGVAVVLTQRLRPRGVAAFASIALTLAFNLATSLLFFATVNQIFPWYSDGVGG